jgi:hypothetical protein
MKKIISITLGISAVLAAGCMPDAELVKREEATSRLRAEARELGRKVARVEHYKHGLETDIATDAPARNATTLMRELSSVGFSVRKGRGGVIRLTLPAIYGTTDGTLDAVTASRLSRGAALLREYLPNHELSIQSHDLGRAVAAVRVLNEQAGVPGLRLRAATGRTGALLVEVRPTQIEALQEVLAATVE